MIDWILKFQWNSLMGILLYWVPALFCATFYTVRTAEGYMRDRNAREAADAEPATRANPLGKTYHPRETIGAILGRALVSITPVANIWAALFDLSPKVLGRAFKWIGAVFDQPLVPPRSK